MLCRVEPPQRRKVLFALLLGGTLWASGCANNLTMYARDGEKLDGKWRFGREGGGLIQVVGTAGEVLVGTFNPVPRKAFLEGYQRTFGGGTIDTDGPDISAFGNPFAGMLFTPNALLDVAQSESYNVESGKTVQTVSGPLFYWTANLRGDKRTTMLCFLIGSSYTGRGLGRCKGGEKEYTVEF